MSSKGKTAFIGLGVMGFPMAGHLAAAGYEMTVYNRTQETADRWVEEHEGRAAATPSEAARNADFVFTCVGNDDDLRSVVLGEQGAFAGMKPGAVLIDNTTTSAIVARELAAIAQEKGLHFLDAPVSGGQAGAENAALTVMVGGDSEVFGKAQSAMQAYGKAVTLMGGSGSGQLTKMVNQICIAGMVQALAEGLNFSQRAGLDGDLVLDVISKGAAQSWQMENRGKTMLRGEFEFGFAVDWMRKDLGICLEEADRNGARLQVTALVDQFYKHVQQKGGGRFDTSSLMLPLIQD
tara:strand:+ start:160 stop:1038 length:879 start_codon:yes stop_codon:yes gene_type:complete